MRDFIKVKNTRLKTYLIYILIIISSVYFILSYGSIDDFIFKHIGFTNKIDVLGYIPNSDPIFSNRPPQVPGFYVLMVQASIICNLPYDVLSFLPLQLIPLILVILIVLRSINNHLILYPILLIYVTFSHTLSLSIHGTGTVLFFLIMASAKLYQSKDSHKKRASSLIIFLSLISINYISYKATVFALLFILSLLFIEYFERLKPDKNLMTNWTNIFLVGIIITLSFNQFIYDNAIPTIRLSYESGINPFILRMFGQTPTDPLGIYGFYYTYPPILNYIKIIRIVLLGIVTIISLFYITQRTIKNTSPLRSAEKIFLALFITGSGNLLIYILMGLFDIGFLTYAGFMALVILYDISIRYSKHNSKKLVFLVIATLIAMNIFYQVTIYTTYNSVTQSDENNFDYIRPMASWYLSYVAETDLNLKTDVLTEGYIIKEIAQKNISNYPSIFYADDIFFMTQTPINTTYRPSEILYAVNYRIQHFSIMKWRILKSLNYFKEKIESNPNLNKIYSNQATSIYSINQ